MLANWMARLGIKTQTALASVRLRFSTALGSRTAYSKKEPTLVKLAFGYSEHSPHAVEDRKLMNKAE
jgi:hypothetical protein